jgi:hypothetical protein
MALVELSMLEQRYLAVREVLDTGATVTDVATLSGCFYSTERTPSAKPLDLLVFKTRDREVNRALIITGTIDVAAKRSVERHEVGVP